MMWFCLAIVLMLIVYFSAKLFIKMIRSIEEERDRALREWRRCNRELQELKANDERYIDQVLWRSKNAVDALVYTCKKCAPYPCRRPR